MVQRWAGSHDLPRSDRTLGPQVPVLTTITLLLQLPTWEVCPLHLLYLIRPFTSNKKQNYSIYPHPQWWFTSQTISLLSACHFWRWWWPGHRGKEMGLRMLVVQPGTGLPKVAVPGIQISILSGYLPFLFIWDIGGRNVDAFTSPAPCYWLQLWRSRCGGTGWRGYTPCSSVLSPSVLHLPLDVCLKFAETYHSYGWQISNVGEPTYQGINQQWQLQWPRFVTSGHVQCTPSMPLHTEGRHLLTWRSRSPVTYPSCFVHQNDYWVSTVSWPRSMEVRSLYLCLSAVNKCSLSTTDYQGCLSTFLMMIHFWIYLISAIQLW